MLTAVLVASAALAASAQAATPIEVGGGADVAIAVDGAGNTHVATRQGPPDAAPGTLYCRIPNGSVAQTCPEPRTFPPRTAGNGVFSRSLVAAAGGAVVVLWDECCTPDEVNAQVSSDFGATFAPRTLAAVGTQTPVAPGGDAITDGTIVGWTSGVASSDAGFQAAGVFDGPPATVRADLFGTVSFGAVSAFNPAAPGAPIVVEETGDSQLRFWRFTGGGSLNTEAGWGSPNPIPTTGNGFKRPALTADATDLFLAYTDSAAGGADRPLVRRYDPASNSFGDPVEVADATALEIDVAADPTTGLLHVVWGNSRGIWWASSSDRGVTFTDPVRLTDDDPTHLHVAAGAGVGFAGYRTLDGRVWAIPLEAPENEIRFAKKVKRNKRKGTAKLTVIVPGPGELELERTKKVKPQAKSATAAGKVRLTVRPKRKLMRKLERRGAARVRVRVTFTPIGGLPNTESKRLRLVKR